MVIGVSKQPSIRRSFEDEFVTQLKAAGVDAVPSYLYISEDGQVESRLQAAGKQANADAVIITRLVRGSEKDSSDPGLFYEPVPGLGYGFYDGHSCSLALVINAPRKPIKYHVNISETNLYHMARTSWCGPARWRPLRRTYQQRNSKATWIPGHRRAQEQEYPGRSPAGCWMIPIFFRRCRLPRSNSGIAKSGLPLVDFSGFRIEIF